MVDDTPAVWYTRVFPAEIADQIVRFCPRLCIHLLSLTHRGGRAWARRELRKRSTAFLCTHCGPNEGGNTYVFSPFTGNVAWSRSLGAGSTCAPAVESGMEYKTQGRETALYTCDNAGTVESHNIETQTKRWTTPLRMEVCNTQLLLCRGNLLVRALCGVLVCLCSRTGREKWRTASPRPEEARWGVYDTAPAKSFSGKMVYFIDYRRVLVGVSIASGQRCWRAAQGCRTYARGDPVVGKGSIWLTCTNEKIGDTPYEYIVCLASNTGRPVWSRYAGFEQCGLRLTSKNLLLVTDFQGGVSALNPKTGHALWSVKTTFRTSVTASPPRDGLIFLVDNGASLCALRARNGTYCWRVPLPYNVSSPPVYVHGLVLVASETEGVFAYFAHDGRCAWQREMTPAEEYIYCRAAVLQ